MALELPVSIARRIRAGLDDGFDLSADLAELAEVRALQYLREAEAKYLKVIKAIPSSNPAAYEKARQELFQVQAQIDNLLIGRSEQWARTYYAGAYANGINTIQTTLEAVVAVDYSVKEMLSALSAFTWSKQGQALLAGEYSMAKEAFTSWNQETADWLTKTLADAADHSVPLGSFADVGKTTDTLMNRLLRDDGKLRGYEIETESGKIIHRSAEQTAQAISRVEMNKIENQAARIEANAVGLSYCYNANPMDLNTTPPCRRATDAGIIPVDEMEEKYGMPPRLDEVFHLCRSKIVYVRKEWAEGR